MLTPLLAATLAHAAPGSAGALHLGASSIEPGERWAGSGAIGVWGDGLAGAAGIEGGAALGARARGALTVAMAVEPSTATVPLAAAVRHQLVDGPRLRLAATGHGVVVPAGLWGEGDGAVSTFWSPGLALEAGAERVYFDMSLPVWGISSYDRFVGPARHPFPLAATIGLDVEVSDQHRLRLGLPELISWSVRTERVYFDLGGFTILGAGLVWTKLGAVF